MDQPTYLKTFRDDLKREWTVNITTAALKRCIARCNFDFNSLVTDLPVKNPTQAEMEATAKPLQDFLDDEVKFSEVLYAVLKLDVDAAGLTQEQFDEGFKDNAKALSRKSFLQALYDFFLPPPKKLMVLGVMEEMKRLEQIHAIGMRRAREMIAKIDPLKAERMTNEQIDKAIRESGIDSTLSTSATKSLDKPEELILTPKP